MACRALTVVLGIFALSACAGGEESTSISGGFGSSLPTTTPPPAGSTGSGGSEPTGGTDGSDSSSGTSDPIRPDMGVMSSSSTADGETGVDPSTTTTTTTTTDTSSTSTTGPAIVCGDNMIEGTEECEGADLDGQDCITFGFSGGTLSCANCLFDKSKCVSESCSDGIKNGGEECDCGQQPAPCTAAQLGNQSCQGLVSPNGGNYHSGTLTCGSPQSCTFNKTQCGYCGDGLRNGPEACEGADLGGQSCQSFGFAGGGALKCSASCTHDTSSCVNIVCGNGQCQQGEDSCTCPADCPDDPNSCSACQCGSSGGNCFCDDACTLFGDCCFNGPC